MLEKVSEEKRVDPRIKRTRQLLRRALMELVTEKSFQAITVQDIADRATVNRVTFYAHFEDKFALLEDTMHTMFQERLRAALPEGSRLTPANLARLIELVGETVTEFNARCPPPHGHFDNLMEKQVKASVYELLRTWLAELPNGTAQIHPTLDQVAMIASWAIYGAAVEWSKNQPREPAAEFAQQVLPLILASLQPKVKQ
jgi:AcrR family transcriptional regulator